MWAFIGLLILSWSISGWLVLRDPFLIMTSTVSVFFMPAYWLLNRQQSFDRVKCWFLVFVQLSNWSFSHVESACGGKIRLLWWPLANGGYASLLVLGWCSIFFKKKIRLIFLKNFNKTQLNLKTWVVTVLKEKIPLICV